MNWLFLLIFQDLLLNWITSRELDFSLDFLWFTVGLNHIPWIGFFSWFPVIYCQIESHLVNWVFPLISCLIELHPVHLVVPIISCWIKSQPVNFVFPMVPHGIEYHLVNFVFPWFPIRSCDFLLNWITISELNIDILNGMSGMTGPRITTMKCSRHWLGGRSMIWWAFDSLERHADGSPCIVVCEVCLVYLWQ